MKLQWPLMALPLPVYLAVFLAHHLGIGSEHVTLSESKSGAVLNEF